MASISTKVGNFSLDNPVILASGILDETSGSILRSIRSGAGAVVTKSIGMKERKGYPTPVISEISTGLLNAVGLSNPGIDNFIEEFKNFPEKKRTIVSIFGGSVEDFVTLARKVEGAGFDKIELNLSCPHVQGVGSEVGQDADLVESIITEIKERTNLHIWAKLTPNVTDIISLAKASEKADAYVLINTLRATGVEIYSRKFVLANIVGGYSGPGIKPVALRAVYDVYKETGKDIVGVGGITNWQDAIEFFLVGARAIQIGTALLYEDYPIYKKINNGITQYLDSEGFSGLDEIVGVMVNDGTLQGH
ncbi:MAG: dihydroorotate dehydrogenase [Thermoplasmatales archaeon]|nr:dihydroorotate dehydrogenase [Candidatus Thermoplasmatota archaeon]MCL6002735.1 dihydroorotate dehydrogenase [Candidatus Thermoplasmatota archaeon]MDA8054726.1 dihydroorotate dehydrogenase [Thermoplasmatales archaeon]